MRRPSNKKHTKVIQTVTTTQKQSGDSVETVTTTEVEYR